MRLQESGSAASPAAWRKGLCLPFCYVTSNIAKRTLGSPSVGGQGGCEQASDSVRAPPTEAGKEIDLKSGFRSRHLAIGGSLRRLGWLASGLMFATGLSAVAAPLETPHPGPLPTPAGEPIELVATLPGLLLNGVAVSPTGRIFVSLPRWAGTATPGVVEVLPDGSYRPFPGGKWHEWRPGMPASQGFVAVRSINADSDGNLWVVDEGQPSVGVKNAPFTDVIPKIVQIDVARGEVVDSYPLSRDVTPPGAKFGHMRVDKNFLYITEPGLGSLVIIDRKTRQAHRRLMNAKAAKADPTINPAFAGVPLAPPGQVPQIHLDHVEIDATGKKLFFMTLFGPTLFSIEIADLTDWSLSEQDLERRISVEGPVPPATGLRRDDKGDLYICAITEFAILRRKHDGGWDVVSRDPRIYVPNSPSLGPDGDLYFPVSLLPGFPSIGIDGPSAVYRINLGRSS